VPSSSGTERLDQLNDTIEQFAERNRLKTRIDRGDDTKVILGKLGHLYEYGPSTMGLCFIPEPDPTKPERTKLWNARKQACLDAGMTLQQDGDAEGCMSFDPANHRQSKLAISVVKAKTKRVMSPEQLAHLATMRQKASDPSKMMPKSA
jgi:hypothetical protein